MKAAVALITILLLGGCSVDGWEVTRAYELCAEHRGVDEYDDLINKVQCVDGSFISINELPSDERK